MFTGLKIDPFKYIDFGDLKLVIVKPFFLVTEGAMVCDWAWAAAVGWRLLGEVRPWSLGCLGGIPGLCLGCGRALGYKHGQASSCEICDIGMSRKVEQRREGRRG